MHDAQFTCVKCMVVSRGGRGSQSHGHGAAAIDIKHSGTGQPRLAMHQSVDLQQLLLTETEVIKIK